MDQFVNERLHKLMSDLFKTSVIVVSSNTCVSIQIGRSASINMTKVSGSRYDPWGIPATICTQSDITSPITFPLTLMSEKGAYPADDDIWQV